MLEEATLSCFVGPPLALITAHIHLGLVVWTLSPSEPDYS